MAREAHVDGGVVSRGRTWGPTWTHRGRAVRRSCCGSCHVKASVSGNNGLLQGANNGLRSAGWIWPDRGGGGVLRGMGDRIKNIARERGRKPACPHRTYVFLCVFFVCLSAVGVGEEAPPGCIWRKLRRAKVRRCVTCLVRLAPPPAALSARSRGRPVESRALYSTFVYSTTVLLELLSNPFCARSPPFVADSSFASTHRFSLLLFFIARFSNTPTRTRTYTHIHESLGPLRCRPRLTSQGRTQDAAHQKHTVPSRVGHLLSSLSILGRHTRSPPLPSSTTTRTSSGHVTA